MKKREMKKMVWWILGIVAALLAVTVVVLMLLPKPQANVGDRSKLQVTASAENRARLEAREVTRDELSAATCSDGAACWIAVDGVVYDMSGIPAWARGRHHGIRAGTDATEKFVGSGHGAAVLASLPVVGRLQP